MTAEQTFLKALAEIKIRQHDLFCEKINPLLISQFVSTEEQKLIDACRIYLASLDQFRDDNETADRAERFGREQG